MTSNEREVVISRHRTAIKRGSFSLPVKCLLRDGLLDTSKTLFDYGCGHGRDLELLSSMRIECLGWDPSFRPNVKLRSANVVNLSYVINVIEDVQERTEAIRRAWDLCTELLTVAAQIKFAAPDKELQQFADGFLTSRQTFQKYYNQHELREYIESITACDAVSAAPGVFYVFKDEFVKQQFLANRYHRRVAVPRRKVSELLFEQNQDVLEPMMQAMAQYGRLPAMDELTETEEIVRRFGTLNRAFKIIQKVTGDSTWEEIAQKRTEDLLVYLALSRFKKRPPLSKLPVTIQHDIKSFLSGYKVACARADALLFRTGDPDAIDKACQRATVGDLVDNALLIHRSALDSLEPLLRIYEGCAASLVGEIDDANIVKLHRFSGKVSYVSYQDFETVAHPSLQTRVKVSLRSLAIDLFNYSNWQDPPLLFRKERYLSTDHPLREKFARLTRQEEKRGLLDGILDSEAKSRWLVRLAESGYQVRGHQVVKA